jgi:hypothetical protein
LAFELKSFTRQLQQKERFLELQREVLAQLYRQWIIDNERVKTTLGHLELWRKQAGALEDI